METTSQSTKAMTALKARKQN